MSPARCKYKEKGKLICMKKTSLLSSPYSQILYNIIHYILPFKNYTLLRNERFTWTNLTADKQTDLNGYFEIRFNDTIEKKKGFISRMAISFLERNSSREFCEFRDQTLISRARITGKEPITRERGREWHVNTGNFVRHSIKASQTDG